MILTYLNPFHILTEWLLSLSFQDYTAVIVQILILCVIHTYHWENLAVFTNVTINTGYDSSEQRNLILGLYEDVATLRSRIAL